MAVVTRRPVPANTLINSDNVSHYFATVEVKQAPEGVVTNPDDLKGKFIIKSLDEGQYLFKSLTGNDVVRTEPIPPPMKTPTAPTLPAVTPATPEKTFERFEQVIVEGGFSKRIIWLLVDGKWKRFDSEREVDDFKRAANKPAAKAGP
jgi:hypothetical protein